MIKFLRPLLAAASAAMLITATIPAAQAQNTGSATVIGNSSSDTSSDTSSNTNTEKLTDASSRGSSMDRVDSFEDYAEWTSSGAEKASSGDPELSAEGSSRLAVDWAIGVAVTFVIGAVIYAVSSLLPLI
ncbi:hypothetical protein [Corynebacterium cystitidis]|uniref:hypothetical protein n=1 Tax=Corynebacterium cystitidis TaxID=35757 RepID=UPI00211F0802|nr:hypothetical protein [Corynebacterium cystitidis]